MQDFVMLGLEITIFIIFGLIGLVFKMVFNAIRANEVQTAEVEKSLHNHKLHAAETFATKVDVDKGFDRIMDKLDSMDTKLDHKADKE